MVGVQFFFPRSGEKGGFGLVLQRAVKHGAWGVEWKGPHGLGSPLGRRGSSCYRTKGDFGGAAKAAIVAAGGPPKRLP